MMFSRCVTILFFIDVVTSFRSNNIRFNLSHLSSVYDDYDKLYTSIEENDIKRDLRGFIFSLCPFRIPDVVLDNWYNKLVESGLDLRDLRRIIPYADPSAYKINDSTNMLPYPFERSELDDIIPLIGSKDKEELNKKYEAVIDELAPEYVLTECLISTIREIYDDIPEERISYEDDWENYEEGIREGFIDQNISENYYLPTPDGQLPKLRGVERYYRERVKEGADPTKEAEKILEVMKRLRGSEEYEFDFGNLPRWTKDISLAVIRYFAAKTNNDKFLEMLVNIGKEFQNIRYKERKRYEWGKKYVEYCFTRRKKLDCTGPHKPQKPFWYWRDVVSRISPDDDTTINEIINQIKKTDPSIDIDKLTQGTLDPYYLPKNPSEDDLIRVEMLKNINSKSKKPNNSDSSKEVSSKEISSKENSGEDLSGEDLSSIEISKLLPGFTPPVHIANYFRDCLSQTKYEAELKRYNRGQFGSEDYKIYLGQIVTGTITMIEAEMAYVDIGAHMTAKLPIQQVFEDPKTIPFGGLTKIFKEGDILKFEIIEIWPEEIKVSLLSLRELYKLKGVLENHIQNKQMLFTVKDYYSKGLFGDVMGYRAFLPRVHLTYDYQDAIRLYRPGLEGTTIPVMYLDYNYNDRVVIVSNCKAIEHEQVKFVRIGDILRCKPHHITNHGLVLKALNVHCIMSPYEMSPTHFEQFQKGFLCTNEIFAQVIDVGKTVDGNVLVSLSSRRGIDDQMILSSDLDKILPFGEGKRGINEFIKDWKKFQFNQGLPTENPSSENLSRENPSLENPSVEDFTISSSKSAEDHLSSGHYSLLTDTPDPMSAIDEIFEDKSGEMGDPGVLMDLDDEDYVSTNDVFKEAQGNNLVWYVDTKDGCVQLSSAEQRYLTNAYNQNDQIARYLMGGNKIMVDFEEGTYYNFENGTMYKIFSRDLQQRLKL